MLLFLKALSLDTFVIRGKSFSSGYYLLKAKLQRSAVSGRRSHYHYCFSVPSIPLRTLFFASVHIRARLFGAIGFDIFLQPLPAQPRVKTAAGTGPRTSAAAARRWFRHREASREQIAAAAPPSSCCFQFLINQQNGWTVLETRV